MEPFYIQPFSNLEQCLYVLVSEALVGSGNSAGCHFSCSGDLHGSCKNIELKAFPFSLQD